MEGSCQLNDFPREINTPTVNLVSGHLVACYDGTCEIYKGGLWQHLQNTTVQRIYHSSASTEEAVLLIGGGNLKTVEWIPVDGSPAHQGQFTIRHGYWHCTIQISADIIVLTGGTSINVTQYQLPAGTETPMTSFRLPRSGHACGVYKDTDDQQVRKKVQLQALHTTQ